MGKRANQSAAKPTKKVKVDPALAAIADVVKKAGHLPEQCSTMLAGMLPFSLAIASNERAESQQRVVDMVEETLNTMKSEMGTAASAEDGKLDTLKGTMAELLDTVKGAEAALEVSKEALQVANASLADATVAANASGETLTDRQAEHTTCSANLASVQEDKTALEKAFQDHFQTPMEAGEGPHFKALETFLQTMEIEKSLHSTLPGTCAKSKECRGSFDDVILQQLAKAITDKISALAETVTVETSAVAERAGAVQNVETEHNSKKETQDRSTAEFDTAQTEQSNAETALTKANEAVNEFRTQLEGATELCELTAAKLVGFESGPLTSFATFKTRTNLTTPVESAPGGA